ncbi:MAG: beta-lactamase family protein [bacterium]|nr:beta-lactamase family protein [bacterium]
MTDRLSLLVPGLLALGLACPPLRSAPRPQAEAPPPTETVSGKPTAFETGDPATVGCDSERLAAASSALHDAVESGRILGGVVLAARGRTIVLHEASGFRDPGRQLPMQQNTLFRMASNTKAVTAAAILTLVADGKVALEDPAAKWLPDFQNGDAAKITVAQLLTHTSGLRIPTLFLSPLMQPSERHPNAPNLVLEASRFGAVGPEVTPGTSYRYSNPGYNTLAAIVEVAAGESFEAFCHQRFYEPLRMRDSNHHESTADQSRMATVVRSRADDDWNVRWRPGDPPTVPFVRGSGGMISTTTDFLRFCRVFLDDGRSADVRILPPELVRAATQSQTEHIEGASYGFGWRIERPGVFSHGGSDGTFAWCDAERDLVGMVFTQTQDNASEVRRTIRRLIDAACPKQR